MYYYVILTLFIPIIFRVAYALIALLQLELLSVQLIDNLTINNVIEIRLTA
ncbi:hypothetical protein YPPY66_4673 [Yersinia pestis PY-66]|nr:hypothetical protein YpMG051020_1585 [Yersinia pestis biovar Orientalis str. MG05-1020]EIQ83956.1 hypothetical protein YPPY01_4255 [Yersinia pestis PY-01]EIQ84115.1 hypothetical protein YPPY02_4315 [Yersinia pestis PY-02]EIQ84224.1 hypothetical protein YPPY03_4395 [Yersinia pestis PY-03]EIQ97230.1 hypothetical protein YPPY04_4323 [Yersinia pestis PY-04]EIQ98417.1 hypothetical protein YPPY05_4301 [Yersinia pestis PY-05]EIR14497.1 hypothetical protein YPPY09_4368 [Yersinia pestis PY-09]EIR2